MPISKAINKTKKLFVILKLVVISFFTLAGFIACNELSRESDTPNVPASSFASNKQTISTKIYGDATFELKETNYPHQYQIFISWPKNISKIFIEDFGTKVFETNSHQQYIYTIRDNIKYNLRLFSTDEGKPVLLGGFAGQTPKDYSIDSETILKENLTINADRVFLTKRAKVQINGFEFTVATSKFFSDEAKIYSFPHYMEKAPRGTLGQSGGRIRITSEVAYGRLHVELRGQDGGDGSNGSIWPTRAADGAQGGSGSHECLQVSFVGLPIGGPIKCWCTRSPGNGAPGANGAKGYNGTPGGKGGNSGSLFVKLQQDTGFVIHLIQSEGHGGIPGVGGPGQEGGYGGPSGNPTADACPNANAGPNGFRGPKGDDAPPSLHGSIDPSCILIGSNEEKCPQK